MEEREGAGESAAKIAIVSSRLEGTLAAIARLLSLRHLVLHSSTADAALAAVRDHRVGLVIVGDDLPQARATTLLRGLRPSWSGPSVFMADKRHDIHEQSVALESGFDDAWPHDIDARLACARAHALMRREDTAAARSPEILHGAGLVLDRGRRVIAYRGAELPLTPRETDALEVLLRRKGRLVERREFGAGDDSLAIHRDVDAVVCRLRRKIRAVGALSIEVASVRGRGYTLRSND